MMTKYVVAMMALLILAACGKESPKEEKFDVLCMLPLGVMQIPAADVTIREGSILQIKKEKGDKETEVILVNSVYCVLSKAAE
jgi:hypothetical protein